MGLILANKASSTFAFVYGIIKCILATIQLIGHGFGNLPNRLNKDNTTKRRIARLHYHAFLKDGVDKYYRSVIACNLAIVVFLILSIVNIIFFAQNLKPNIIVFIIEVIQVIYWIYVLMYRMVYN